MNLFLLTIFSVSYCIGYEDEFHEELLLKPLYTDKLYAFFQFSTIWNAEPTKETCKFIT